MKVKQETFSDLAQQRSTNTVSREILSAVEIIMSCGKYYYRRQLLGYSQVVLCHWFLWLGKSLKLMYV